jgi:hypothetical protein
MECLLSALDRYQPIISLLTLLALLWYAFDTLRIRKASVVQARSQLQPCLVLLGEAREEMQQLFDTLTAPAAASELGRTVMVKNIGAGPAHSIILSFKHAADPKAHDWAFTLPHLSAGEAHEVPLGRNTLIQGEWIFRADYRSLSDAMFTSRQAISDGQLQEFKLVFPSGQR